jgi:hypothetical protein
MVCIAKLFGISNFPTTQQFHAILTNRGKKAGPFLILSCLIEYINLSDVVPIKIGFFRGQRDNENRLSGPFQYICSHTSKKSVSQESFSVSSKDDRIATFFIRCLQNLFYGISQGDKDFGYQFDAWRAKLILYFITEILKIFLDFPKVNLPLLFFAFLQYLVNASRHSFRVQVTNRFDRMQNDNFCVMPFGHIGSIQKGIRRVLTEIRSIKNLLDSGNHFSPPFLLFLSFRR